MNGRSQKARSRDAELERDGWARRFVAGEPRLAEAVELYKSLGYEVKLEPPIFDEASQECKKCLLHQDQRCKTIYVRPRKKSHERKEIATYS